MSGDLARKGVSRGGVAALQVVEAEFGSLEEFAHFVMVERPELLEADFEVVAAACGLPVGVVTWLFRSSREFGVLLDWFVAGDAWSLGERRVAYGELARSASDSRVSVGERVRAMEYLDRKLGVAGRGAGSGEGGGVNVAVQVVQEGDGSWSSDYEPLTFSASGGRDGGDVGVGSGEGGDSGGAVRASRGPELGDGGVSGVVEEPVGGGVVSGEGLEGSD